MASNKSPAAELTISSDDLAPKQTLTFASPKDNILMGKAEAMVAPITGIVVDSPAMYQVVDEELRKIKGAIKALEDMRRSVSDPLHKAKTANDLIYKAPMEVLEKARRAIERAMLEYTTAQERQRQEAQRKAEAAARAERERLEAQARQIEDEAAAKALAGDETAAEELFQAAESAELESQLVTAATVEPTQAKVAGTSTTYRYSAIVPQLKSEAVAALRYIIANPQFLSLVTFNQSAANQLAVALKENFAVPGFKLDKRATISQRGVKADSSFI